MDNLQNIIPTQQELEKAKGKENQKAKTRKANKVARQMRKQNRKG